MLLFDNYNHYYDHDLYLYVLGTRLYDPNNFRFVSPDRADVITATPEGLTDKNLYAYCDNNPIMRVDHDGESWLGALIGAAIGAVVGGVSAAISGGDIVDVAIGVATGAVGGVLTASGVGQVGQVVGSGLISMAANAAGQIKNIIKDETGNTEFSTIDMLFDGVVAAGAAILGGDGATHGNNAGIKASWKQLTKKGLTNSNARTYFYKTAHNSSKKHFMTSLYKSSAINTGSSVIITLKNVF